jgi:hypothetical protein
MGKSNSQNEPRKGFVTAEIRLRGSRYIARAEDPIFETRASVTYYNEEQAFSRERVEVIHDVSFGEVRQ